MATVINATTSNTPSTNDLSPEMKTYYAKRLLQYAEPNLVYNQFADKYPIPQGEGKTIQMRRYSTLPTLTSAITEGITPDGQALNVESITATVDQYGGWVQMTDLLKLAAIDNNLTQASKLLGAQAGRSKDALTRDVVCAGTNVIFAPTWSGTTPTAITARGSMNATSLLDVDLIFKAVAQLEAMNTDPFSDGSFVGIIHPYAAYDLMRSSEWIEAHKYADPEKIYKGEIGKVGNVRFVQSTQAKVWKSSADNCPSYSDGGTKYYGVFATMIIGQHAYGATEIEGGGLEMIIKQLGYGDDPLNQRSSAGWKMTHVAKRLSEDKMVRIEHLSAYSKTVSAN